MNRHLLKTCRIVLREFAVFFIIGGGCLRRGIQGWVTHLQTQLPSTLVLATILISYFTVVVLVGGAAEQPASSSELQDLQQQQTGHGGEALL